jgi:hypothetical protein
LNQVFQRRMEKGIDQALEEGKDGNKVNQK